MRSFFKLLFAWMCFASLVCFAEVVEPSEYDTVEPFINGYACVGKDGKFGLIDESKRIVVPTDYECIQTFDIFEGVYTDFGFCKVSQASGVGIYDIMNQKLVLPCEYSEVYIDIVGTGLFLKGQYPPLETSDYGWVWLCEYDIYNCDYTLVYNTIAYNVKLSEKNDGNGEKVLIDIENEKHEKIMTEIDQHAWNRKIQTIPTASNYLYSYEKVKRLREFHDSVFDYYRKILYIVVDNDNAYFIDIDGNNLEYTKINTFEYDWEAIRVNGKVFSEDIFG